MAEIADAVTRDAFFGGRLILSQPAKGHRSGTDAVLLAAAAPRDFSGLACDIGAGVGAAGLGIALACPAARMRLVERDPAVAALAAENIAAAGLADRCVIVTGDVLRGRPLRELPDADLVVTNPPFWQADQVRPSPHEGRSAAHVLDPGKTLTDWLRACVDDLVAQGTLVVIHAPMALPEIIEAMGRWLGALTILPVHPRADAPAVRVLVRGTRGSRAPLTIAAPLVLHEPDGRFTQAGERLHRGEVGLAW